MTPFRHSLIATAVAVAFPLASAWAQQAPDAGQTLQQQQQRPSLPPSPGTGVDIQAPASPATPAGGQQVTLQSVSITGNRVFTEAELQAALGTVAGQSYDLAGLRGLADRISAHYRAAGYPFARAFLPPQPLNTGTLLIEVVEGRYGKVVVSGDASLTPAAQDYLATLQAGQAIESAQLERATLILDDLPGIKITPIIRPGQELGTGDLDVQVSRASAISGDVGADNHGNRYTGQHRLRANLQWDSPFLFGDQITVRSLLSEENMWLGSLGYSLPVGASGLRAQLSYARTAYELGKDFASLDASGTADVASVGLTYPLLRSQRSNLTVGASLQHKKLHDEQGAAASDNRKLSNSLPVSLQFDHRDTFGGGGITYGTAVYTHGNLMLDAGLKASDIASGQDTRGSFNKFNLDVARVQALPAGFSLFGRFSGQWADQNLDSSESFTLGGAHGVRAFPSGEGNGDTGWLVQAEVRYSLGDFMPYVFHDNGRVAINARASGIVPAVSDNHRSVAGGGVGLRYQRDVWNADLSVAWRTQGGQPTSDTVDRTPRAWFTLGYAFK